MSKHTPAPWRYSGPMAGTPSAVMHPNGSIQLAHVLTGRDLDGTRIDGDEAEANARLIAAAPTMYNYLTKLASCGDNEAHAIITQIAGS